MLRMIKKTCYFCEKKNSHGNTLQRRGIAKKKKGIGLNITSTTKRIFKPNLQKVKALIEGETAQIWACAKCIKKGKVVKPLIQPKP